MKILSIIGARPQFIKAAVVSPALAAAGLEECLVHTGQHYDKNMSELFIDELKLPDFKYRLEAADKLPGARLAQMLMALEPIIQQENPDWILVYGDTDTTLAGAISAAKAQVPLAHVEAGLRSFNPEMPEEHNRRICDHLSQVLFTPCERASQQLQAEGIAERTIIQVGDVMYDALLQYKAKLPVQAVTDSYGLPGSYILCSLHRAENTLNTARLEACIARLCELSEDHHLVMPLHPGTRAALEKAGIFHKIEKVAQILDPVGYLDMLTLQEAATAIITDSGGVQKEAYFLNRPCLIFRNESEWLELLETGRHQLFDVMSEQNCGKILESLITCPNEAEKNIYGNGNAAEKVAAFFAS